MTLRDFEIDEDIRRASTLPARVYSDPEYFEAQKDRVFARSWQYVGDAARVKAPGRVLPLSLLDGCLSEPLVLTSDDDGNLRCLSNVCTHRGAIVVEGEGHARNLRCRYHGRRFALDGKFVSMPEFDTTVGFPSEKDNLPNLPLQKLGPLLFTGLAPEMSFDEWIAPVRERGSFMPLDAFMRDGSTSDERECPSSRTCGTHPCARAVSAPACIASRWKTKKSSSRCSAACDRDSTTADVIPSGVRLALITSTNC